MIKSFQSVFTVSSIFFYPQRKLTIFNKPAHMCVCNMLQCHIWWGLFLHLLLSSPRLMKKISCIFLLDIRVQAKYVQYITLLYRIRMLFYYSRKGQSCVLVYIIIINTYDSKVYRFLK